MKPLSIKFKEEMVNLAADMATRDIRFWFDFVAELMSEPYIVSLPLIADAETRRVTKIHRGHV